MVILPALPRDYRFHRLGFVLDVLPCWLALIHDQRLLVLLNGRGPYFEVEWQGVLDDHGHLDTDVPGLLELGGLDEDHAELLLVVHEELLLLDVPLLVEVADSERR